MAHLTGHATMNTLLRISTLALTAGVSATLGLIAAPPRASDGTLGRPPAPVDLAEAGQWSLRPTKVTAAAALTTRPGKTVALSELPMERRAVRVVYQGYPTADALSPVR